MAEDKKMNKKEKDERYLLFEYLLYGHWKYLIECYFNRILWKKNEVADYEATTFSIFYNNAMFLAVVIALSFFFLKSFSPTM